LTSLILRGGEDIGKEEEGGEGRERMEWEGGEWGSRRPTSKKWRYEGEGKGTEAKKGRRYR